MRRTPELTSRDLLPTQTPLQMLAPTGEPAPDADLPTPDVLLDLYRRMVIGRRFDAQATALTKQGRLAVYPSSHGQEACQVGAVAALQAQDWLFPTYRDSMAIVTRGVDPVETLSLLRGDWHLGYDPYEHHVGPQCTPLATNAAARRRPGARRAPQGENDRRARPARRRRNE